MTHRLAHQTGLLVARVHQRVERTGEGADLPQRGRQALLLVGQGVGHCTGDGFHIVNDRVDFVAQLHGHGTQRVSAGEGELVAVFGGLALVGVVARHNFQHSCAHQTFFAQLHQRLGGDKAQVICIHHQTHGHIAIGLQGHSLHRAHAKARNLDLLALAQVVRVVGHKIELGGFFEPTLTPHDGAHHQQGGDEAGPQKPARTALKQLGFAVLLNQDRHAASSRQGLGARLGDKSNHSTGHVGCLR